MPHKGLLGHTLYDVKEVQDHVSGVVSRAVTAVVPGEKLVPSWTADGGLFYYTLNHKRGRLFPWIKVFDAMTGDELNYDHFEAIDTDNSKIWMNTDYGASRIVLSYL